MASLGAVMLGFGVTFAMALAATAGWRRSPHLYHYERSMERGRRSTFGLGILLSRRPVAAHIATVTLIVGGVALIVVGW